MSGEPQKRVLVVDDDEDIRGILTTVLRRRGLVVDQASDGSEALRMMTERKYSVVLLDLMMPVIDGVAVLETMRGSAAPVVLVVTAADRSLIDTLDAGRIHGVIRKPFDPEEVALIVDGCAEIKARMPFETMAIATLVAGGPLFELLNRFTS